MSAFQLWKHDTSILRPHKTRDGIGTKNPVSKIDIMEQSKFHRKNVIYLKVIALLVSVSDFYLKYYLVFHNKLYILIFFSYVENKKK